MNFLSEGAMQQLTAEVVSNVTQKSAQSGEQLSLSEVVAKVASRENMSPVQIADLCPLVNKQFLSTTGAESFDVATPEKVAIHMFSKTASVARPSEVQPYAFKEYQHTTSKGGFNPIENTKGFDLEKSASAENPNVFARPTRVLGDITNQIKSANWQEFKDYEKQSIQARTMFLNKLASAQAAVDTLIMWGMGKSELLDSVYSLDKTASTEGSVACRLADHSTKYKSGSRSTETQVKNVTAQLIGDIRDMLKAASEYKFASEAASLKKATQDALKDLGPVLVRG